jgi:chemotaxis protein histidine kinase CheA
MNNEQRLRNGRPIQTAEQQQEMQKKMLEIGGRFLQRTRGEIDDLRRMATDISTRGVDALKDLEVLSHRIRGSGAVFGFAKVSDIAGVIEMLAVESARCSTIDAQLVSQFAQHIDELALEVSAAQDGTLAAQRS